MNTNYKKYIYIAPHFVGSEGNWGMCYDTDFEKFDTRQEAQKWGEETLEHDDFWVAEVIDGICIRLWSGNKERKSKKEVRDINKEWGNF